MDHLLAEVGQIQIFLTYFAIIIMQDNLMEDSYDMMFDVLLTVVNMWVILLGFYYECKDYFNSDMKMVELTESVKLVAKTQIKVFMDITNKAEENNVVEFGDRYEYNMEDVYVCNDASEDIGIVQDISSGGSILRLPISAVGYNHEFSGVEL
jgi:hypothetical protein